MKCHQQSKRDGSRGGPRGLVVTPKFPCPLFRGPAEPFLLTPWHGLSHLPQLLPLPPPPPHPGRGRLEGGGPIRTSPPAPLRAGAEPRANGERHGRAAVGGEDR